jgi:hypothetical protein
MSPYAIKHVATYQQAIQRGGGNIRVAYRLLTGLRKICLTTGSQDSDCLQAYGLLLNAMNQRGWL